MLWKAMVPFAVLMLVSVEIQDYISGLYRDLGSRMMGWAWKELRDSELVKDAVQMALVKLCRNGQTLIRLEEPMRRTYIYRTVHSACTDCIRREEKQRGERYPEELTEDIPSQEASILESLADQVSMQELKQYLLRLSERYRQVLLLRYVEEETQKQVAQRFGVTEQTVRAWERKALEQIREMWRADEDGGE